MDRIERGTRPGIWRRESSRLSGLPLGELGERFDGALVLPDEPGAGDLAADGQPRLHLVELPPDLGMESSEPEQRAPNRAGHGPFVGERGGLEVERVLIPAANRSVSNIDICIYARHGFNVLQRDLRDERTRVHPTKVDRR